MSDEEKITELEKEVARLQRRCKLLERKLKRRHTEVQALSEELEIADVKAAASIAMPDLRDHLCPECGFPLEGIELPVNKTLYMCRCGYRKTE